MRLFKVFYLVLVTGVILAHVHAQNLEGVNARLDGMAGAGVPDDIGWCSMQPRNFIKYPDYIQGSIRVKDYWDAEETFGRIILLKSIGERAVIGLTMNNDLEIWGNFYGRGTEFLDAEFGLNPGSYTSNSLPILPHIGASFKITDDINVGVIGFGEIIKSETEVPYDLAGTKIDSVKSRRLSNFGLSVDANIGLGKFGFAPRFTFGIPAVDGEDRRTDAGVVNGFDFTSEEKLMLRFGSAAWFVGFKLPIVFGIWGKIERYQFSRTPVLAGSLVDTAKVKSAFYKNNYVFGFLGTEIHMNDNFMYTPEYNFWMGKFYTTGADEQIIALDTTFRVLEHVFRQGFEGRVKGKRFFNEIAGRAGLVYKIKSFKTTYIDSNGNELYINKPIIETYDKFDGPSGMKITAGFGLTKRRVTIDVSADLIEWQDGSGSIVNGPRAAMATLTIDIARNARYKEYESSAPPVEEPAPLPIPEEPEPTESEEPVDFDL